jgi:hypothetical protein
MTIRLRAVLLAVAAFVTACSSASTTSSVPAAPQLMPNPINLWVIFAPVEVDGSASYPVIALDGGQADLVISSATIQDYAGPDTDAVFSVDVSAPVTVVYQDATVLPVTFMPQTAGVHRARLVVASNAENLPTATFELVAPAVSAVPPQEPFIAFFPGDGVVSAGATGTFAPVRFFNLGVGELVITKYTLEGTDAASFGFETGTSQPSSACASAACGAPLPAGCQPVRLSYGQWLGLGITYAPTGDGAHTASISIISNASTCPAVLGLSGT